MWLSRSFYRSQGIYVSWSFDSVCMIKPHHHFFMMITFLTLTFILLLFYLTMISSLLMTTPAHFTFHLRFLLNQTCDYPTILSLSLPLLFLSSSFGHHLTTCSWTGSLKLTTIHNLSATSTFLPFPYIHVRLCVIQIWSYPLMRKCHLLLTIKDGILFMVLQPPILLVVDGYIVTNLFLTVISITKAVA